ncbi:hypothetical protein DEI68_21020 [Salmonella enterica subsp. enterica serovar Poona]|nr:hypothetical protein [Salmonella enterica]EEM7113295.1 hypothetical protein [Salmonella enterica subsp. enterica serovar Poona]EEH1295003.1 hypothetical protein [Salmonella enterica]EEO3567273.1 hypothetical protein [Salmonella enterica subsp. enterica serovar Poona]EHZ8150645.1 hypothetical protein [Salmonella enterica]
MSINIRHHGHIHSLHSHQRTQGGGNGKIGRLGNRIVKMKMKSAAHHLFHSSKTSHSQKMAGNTMKNMNVTHKSPSSLNKSDFDTRLDVIKKNLPNKKIKGGELAHFIMERRLYALTYGIRGLNEFSSDPEIKKSAMDILNTAVGKWHFSEFGSSLPPRTEMTATETIRWIKSETDLTMLEAEGILNKIFEDTEKLTLHIDAKSVSSPFLRNTPDERVPESGEKRMAGDWADKIRNEDRKAIYQKGI